MKSRKAKIGVIVLGVVLAIIIVAAVALSVFLRLPHPSYTGTLEMDGLMAAVEVRTDDHGVPHIFAQNEADLFFAQGFITARERMFQMDLTRLAGRGELSTLLGDKTLKKDRFFKTLGFYRASEAEYANLSPEARTCVDAYTRGVNAYIRSVKFLPLEYVILRARPQPWKPADCLVAGLLMSYRLNSPRGVKPLLYQIHNAAGPELFNELLPWIPESAPFISSAGNRRPASPARAELPERAAPAPVAGIDDDGPIPLRMRASNWMIFSGARTTTGKAVFAGSPDLEAVIPSLFYLIHLKGGRYDVIGGSIAGIPGVHAAGFNGRMAWSITVGHGDNLDYFTETVNPANANQYRTEDGYRDFQVREDVIRVKGKGGFREEKLTIKTSRHGPVVSGVMSGLPSNCAMMWPGLMGHDGTVEGLLALNRARNFTEFRQALRPIRGASVHMGYADIDGNIGYQYITTFPRRKSGDNPLPQPGAQGRYDWTGYIPFEDHPFALNPAKGYLASFNQMPEAGDYYGTAFFLFERAYRFEDMVKSKDRFSPEDIRSMQLDVVSTVAKRWVPHILRVCGDREGLSKYASLLRKWDGAMDADSPQATIFNAFFTRLIRNTLEDQLGQALVAELFKDLHVSIPAQWMIRHMNDNGHVLWDDIRTSGVRETRDDMVMKSMKDAIAELTARFGGDPKQWAWGKVHRMTIRHPLGGALPFLNLKPLPYAGDDFTIHAGWWDREHPYDMVSGAAIRIVVDMSNLDTMTLMSPPGQSGHYLSPYYNDLAGLWARGEQIPANYRSAKGLKRLLVLEPKKAL
ncbi:MAG TPA: penicillin acylase family protein [Syntrophales bacterium]|nr:penicillin acylase family protein [Syntrophales bacterium]